MSNITCLEDAGIADIPVKVFSTWGKPVLIGHAIFDDTEHMRIEFLDHQFVSEFYDLREQELTISVSFKYKDPDEPPHVRPLEEGEVDWS